MGYSKGVSDIPTPTTTLSLDEINPGSFDFWLREDVDGALARLRRERPPATGRRSAPPTASRC